MRISAHGSSMDTTAASVNATKSGATHAATAVTTTNKVNTAATTTTKDSNITKQSSNKNTTITEATTKQAFEEVEKNEANKEKLQQAVESLNKFIGTDHTASKFVFHEGLDRYFVQVVDSDTEEVVKEIPPRKLLDAFYEMQKLVGMIVDKKI